MKKSILPYFISVLFFIYGCSDDKQSDDTTIQIKVKNVSEFDYTDVLVNTGGGIHNYGNIISKQNSEYKEFDFAYSYAFVTLQIDGDIHTIQPIDYVGEKRVISGKYTYEIHANDSFEEYGRLSIRLVKDTLKTLQE